MKRSLSVAPKLTLIVLAVATALMLLVPAAYAIPVPSWPTSPVQTRFLLSLRQGQASRRWCWIRRPKHYRLTRRLAA